MNQLVFLLSLTLPAPDNTYNGDVTALCCYKTQCQSIFISTNTDYGVSIQSLHPLITCNVNSLTKTKHLTVLGPR